MVVSSNEQELQEKAAALRGLHVPGRPVVLPNCWDPGSARDVVGAGFPAVATSSAAVAESLGFADHEQAPSAEMFAAVGRIVAAVDAPVTADIESGYGMEAAELVERLLGTGAVGCNLEDTDHARGGQVSPGVHAERVAAVVAAAAAAGVPVVVNARVDDWLHPGSDDDRFLGGVERARRYLDAGADCVYPILLLDLDVIRRFVDAVGGPVNVLAFPGGPTPAELSTTGIARVSYGGSLFHQERQHWQATLGDLRPGLP